MYEIVRFKMCDDKSLVLICCKSTVVAVKDFTVQLEQGYEIMLLDNCFTLHKSAF